MSFDSWILSLFHDEVELVSCSAERRKNDWVEENREKRVENRDKATRRPGDQGRRGEGGSRTEEGRGSSMAGTIPVERHSHINSLPNVSTHGTLAKGKFLTDWQVEQEFSTHSMPGH
jgi:hypothetical protein